MLSEIFDLSLFGATFRMVTPIFLAALGGTFCAQAGVFNIALEGMMLVGAFAAVVGSHFSGSAWIGLLSAIAGGLIMALIFAGATLRMKAHPIVLGIALNMLAGASTTYLLTQIFHVTGAFRSPSLPSMPVIHLPVVQDIPVLGQILSGHSVIVYVSWGAALLGSFLLYEQVIGLRIRAVGQNPQAAGTLGVSVERTRFFAILLCGVLAGMGGAQLSISNVRLFVQNMTAGRGFIALVAVLFGREKPLGVFGASMMFGFLDALSVRIQGASIAPQFVMMIPYVGTIAALFILRDKQVPVLAKSDDSEEKGGRRSG